MAQPAYVFRPMSEADLPLMKRWLAEPHVKQWWGDTNEQFEIVSGDLEVEAMDQFIVAKDDRPSDICSVTIPRFGRITDWASIRRAPEASTSSSENRTW